MLDNFLLAALGVLVGLVLTFYGYALFRLLLPIIGFYYGFLFGQSLAGSSALWAWLFGLLCAVALAFLAYAYWSLLVTVGGAFIGFSLGYTFSEWLGLWNWLSAVIGIVAATGFALLFFTVKDVMVMVYTAFAGAGLIFAGLATFFPSLLGWLGAQSNWLTLLLTLVVGTVGTIAQMFIFSGLDTYSEPPQGGPPYFSLPNAESV